MIMELYIGLDTQEELNNTIGKLLAIPEWFDGVEVIVDGYGTAGWCGSHTEPEEYPELVINDVTITRVFNEYGHGIKLNDKQASLLDDLVNDKLEDACWDYLEANQEDIGDY